MDTQARSEKNPLKMTLAESSKPKCFDGAEEWANWLALSYQARDLCRLRQYPMHRAIALEFIIQTIEKEIVARGPGADISDLEARLKVHRDALETARNQTSDISHKSLNYCVDCTPEYRQKMQDAGRCEHRETVFVIHYSPSLNEASVEGESLVSIRRRPLGAYQGGKVAGAGA